MSNHQPAIVDLGMSDLEYLQCLAQGSDPVKHYQTQTCQAILLQYGIPIDSAVRVAPLLNQLDCSIEEKLLVNQALKHIWHRLTGR